MFKSDLSNILQDGEKRRIVFLLIPSTVYPLKIN